MSESLKVTPISPRMRQLLQMDTIESQLADEFSDPGRAMFIACCAECGRPIETRHLHGLVIPSRADVCTVEAAGACPACGMTTPVFYRMHRDGKIQEFAPARKRAADGPGFLEGILEHVFPSRS